MRILKNWWIIFILLVLPKKFFKIKQTVNTTALYKLHFENRNEKQIWPHICQIKCVWYPFAFCVDGVKRVFGRIYLSILINKSRPRTACLIEEKTINSTVRKANYLSFRATIKL